MIANREMFSCVPAVSNPDLYAAVRGNSDVVNFSFVMYPALPVKRSTIASQYFYMLVGKL